MLTIHWTPIRVDSNYIKFYKTLFMALLTGVIPLFALIALNYGIYVGISKRYDNRNFTRANRSRRRRCSKGRKNCAISPNLHPGFRAILENNRQIILSCHMLALTVHNSNRQNERMKTRMLFGVVALFLVGHGCRIFMDIQEVVDMSKGKDNPYKDTHCNNICASSFSLWSNVST